MGQRNFKLTHYQQECMGMLSLYLTLKDLTPPSPRARHWPPNSQVRPEEARSRHPEESLCRRALVQPGISGAATPAASESRWLLRHLGAWRHLYRPEPF